MQAPAAPITIMQRLAQVTGASLVFGSRRLVARVCVTQSLSALVGRFEAQCCDYPCLQVGIGI
jgi:hypothetical protein